MGILVVLGLFEGADVVGTSVGASFDEGGEVIAVVGGEEVDSQEPNVVA